MSSINQVKVTAKDIEAVSEKLNAFAKQLPPGEQNVMAWLLGRAGQAPPTQEKFLEQTEAEGTSAREAPHLSPGAINLRYALGISQFAKLHPGAAAAGSSVGVTGTVMF